MFLYNSELWTLTITKEKLIDSFHRRILRTSCLNIRWPKKVSNDEVYKRTKHYTVESPNKTTWDKASERSKDRTLWINLCQTNKK